MNPAIGGNGMTVWTVPVDYFRFRYNDSPDCLYIRGRCFRQVDVKTACRKLVSTVTITSRRLRGLTSGRSVRRIPEGPPRAMVKCLCWNNSPVIQRISTTTCRRVLLQHLNRDFCRARVVATCFLGQSIKKDAHMIESRGRSGLDLYTNDVSGTGS